MTWLEQLVQEFYKAQGYWVVANVRYGPLGHGGYVGEADVLAFDPHSRTLVHVECSMGSEAMARRREIFRDKFEKAEAWYQEMLPVPFDRVDKVAILGWSTRLVLPSRESSA